MFEQNNKPPADWRQCLHAPLTNIHLHNLWCFFRMTSIVLLLRGAPYFSRQAQSNSGKSTGSCMVRSKGPVHKYHQEFTKQKSSLKMLFSQLQKSGEISNFSQAVIQNFTFKEPSICFQGWPLRIQDGRSSSLCRRCTYTHIWTTAQLPPAYTGFEVKGVKAWATQSTPSERQLLLPGVSDTLRVMQQWLDLCPCHGSMYHDSPTGTPCVGFAGASQSPDGEGKAFHVPNFHYFSKTRTAFLSTSWNKGV